MATTSDFSRFAISAIRSSVSFRPECSSLTFWDSDLPLAKVSRISLDS